MDLSIIILSYNTREVTKNCLRHLVNALIKTPSIKPQIIVLDNGSNDGSAEFLKEYKIKNASIKYEFIESKKNLGFSKGNNVALKQATGKYVLFLNSDTLIKDVDFEKLLNYMGENKYIGALTVKLVFAGGKIDPASHRGFPTIWRSACYYLQLEKIFGSVPVLNRLFGGYHLTQYDLNTNHEIDSPAGSFYLTRKKILDRIKGYDEAFFMYGEDLDMSYRIKKLGYKIIYYPKYKAVHLKYQSGLKRGKVKIEKKTNKAFYSAMKIFYDKHYATKYPSLINSIVHFGISVIQRIKN